MSVETPGWSCVRGDSRAELQPCGSHAGEEFGEIGTQVTHGARVRSSRKAVVKEAKVQKKNQNTKKPKKTKKRAGEGASLQNEVSGVSCA